MEIDKTNIILNNDGSIYHLGLFPNEINDISQLTFDDINSRIEDWIKNEK